jgi:predicted phosphoadenosine phosphosulfate sulfurtransferase
VKTWERRCYKNGIPDEAPDLLAKSLRVPSYKHIALLLLSNDLCLKGLGFSGKKSDYADLLKKNKSNQIELDLRVDYEIRRG